MADGLDISTMINLGLTAAGVLAVGMALGWLVDTLAGTFPVFLLIGILLGLVGATVYMISRFRMYLKRPGH